MSKTYTKCPKRIQNVQNVYSNVYYAYINPKIRIQNASKSVYKMSKTYTNGVKDIQAVCKMSKTYMNGVKSKKSVYKMSKTYTNGVKCPKRIQNVQNVYKMSKTYTKCPKRI